MSVRDSVPVPHEVKISESSRKVVASQQSGFPGLVASARVEVRRVDGRAVAREGAGGSTAPLPIGGSGVSSWRATACRETARARSSQGGVSCPWRSAKCSATAAIRGVPGCCGQRRRLAQDPSLRFGVELVKGTRQVAHDASVDRVHRQILPLREPGIVRERERLAACLQGGATLTVAKLRRRRLVLAEREGGLLVHSHLGFARVHGCSELPP